MNIIKQSKLRRLTRGFELTRCLCDGGGALFDVLEREWRGHTYYVHRLTRPPRFYYYKATLTRDVVLAFGPLNANVWSYTPPPHLHSVLVHNRASHRQCLAVYTTTTFT